MAEAIENVEEKKPEKVPQKKGKKTKSIKLEEETAGLSEQKQKVLDYIYNDMVVGLEFEGSVLTVTRLREFFNLLQSKSNTYFGKSVNLRIEEHSENDTIKEITILIRYIDLIKIAPILYKIVPRIHAQGSGDELSGSIHTHLTVDDFLKDASCNLDCFKKIYKSALKYVECMKLNTTFRNRDNWFERDGDMSNSNFYNLDICCIFISKNHPIMVHSSALRGSKKSAVTIEIRVNETIPLWAGAVVMAYNDFTDEEIMSNITEDEKHLITTTKDDDTHVRMREFYIKKGLLLVNSRRNIDLNKNYETIIKRGDIKCVE